MSNDLRPLSTIEDLDAAIAASAFRPVLIFKHSATCGTSAVASEEIDDLAAAVPLPADIYVLRIQSARALSNEIERRFRVRHESPQILLIRDGKVVWSATHYRVTAAAITAAVEQALATADHTIR